MAALEEQNEQLHAEIAAAGEDPVEDPGEESGDPASALSQPPTPPQDPMEISDDESVHGAPHAQPVAPQVLVADSFVPCYYEEIGQHAIRVGDAFIVVP